MGAAVSPFRRGTLTVFWPLASRHFVIPFWQIHQFATDRYVGELIRSASSNSTLTSAHFRGPERSMRNGRSSERAAFPPEAERTSVFV
jgi:hypothetical protein